MNAQKIKQILSVIKNDPYTHGDSNIKDYGLYLNKYDINLKDYPCIYGINRKNPKGRVLLLSYLRKVNTYVYMGHLSEGYTHKRNMKLIPLRKKINVG